MWDKSLSHHLNCTSLNGSILCFIQTQNCPAATRMCLKGPRHSKCCSPTHRVLCLFFKAAFMKGFCLGLAVCSLSGKWLILAADIISPSRKHFQPSPWGEMKCEAVTAEADMWTFVVVIMKAGNIVLRKHLCIFLLNDCCLPGPVRRGQQCSRPGERALPEGCTSHFLFFQFCPEIAALELIDIVTSCRSLPSHVDKK